MPSNADLATELGSPMSMTFRHHQAAVQRRSSVGGRRPSLSSNQHRGDESISESANHLPLPATSPGGAGEKSEKVEFLDLPPPPRTSTTVPSANGHGRRAKESLAEGDGFLLPARNPPRYSYFDLFPFSLLVKFLTKRGKQVKGKKGARLRAKLQHHSVTHNLPLELSLYLVCFSSRCRYLFFFLIIPRVRTSPRFRSATLLIQPRYVSVISGRC
jgi:putative membrane protein